MKHMVCFCPVHGYQVTEDYRRWLRNAFCARDGQWGETERVNADHSV
jgi:hypothetical protein